MLTLETEVENCKAVRAICIGHTCIEMFLILIIIIIITIIIIVIIIVITDCLKKGPEVSDAFEVDQA